MGILYYANHEFEFDDVVLAHIQVVITQKLRKREAFFLNWRRSVNVGSGRMSVWISPEVPVSFSGSALRQKDLNQEWIDAMTDASNTTSGIDVLGIAKVPPPPAPRRRSAAEQAVGESLKETVGHHEPVLLAPLTDRGDVRVADGSPSDHVQGEREISHFDLSSRRERIREWREIGNEFLHTKILFPLCNERDRRLRGRHARASLSLCAHGRTQIQ